MMIHKKWMIVWPVSSCQWLLYSSLLYYQSYLRVSCSLIKYGFWHCIRSFWRLDTYIQFVVLESCCCVSRYCQSFLVSHFNIRVSIVEVKLYHCIFITISSNGHITMLFYTRDWPQIFAFSCWFLQPKLQLHDMPLGRLFFTAIIISSFLKLGLCHQWIPFHLSLAFSLEVLWKLPM